ncbi:MAG: hypothetical protein ACTHQQ_16800 [Solirubrobacteraceae bacterium]
MSTGKRLPRRVLRFYLGRGLIPPDGSEPIEMWECAKFAAWVREVPELRKRKR